MRTGKIIHLRVFPSLLKHHLPHYKPQPEAHDNNPTTAAAITPIFTMSHTAAGTFARLSLAEGLPVVVAVGEGEGEGDEESKRTKVVMIVAVMTSIVRMFEGCCGGENRPGLGGMQ
jgi:hypothetical protein